MKIITSLLLGILLLLIVVQSPVQAQYQKLAQSGMKFLAVGQHARQSALGDAFTAADGSSAAMFYNPAGMVRLKGFTDISFGQTQWIADIKHYFAAVAFSPFGGDYGILGIQAQYVNYGTIERTIKDVSVPSGYADLGTYTPFASMVGITYASALSNKFSVGGSLKLVQQDLGEGVIRVDTASNETVDYALDVVAFDFGILYRTGFRSLTFGMTIRNFAREVSYVDENFQLPLTFRIGLSMNALDFFAIDPSTHELFVAVDAEHPRDYPEQVRVGMEYTFAKTISLRAGLVSPADQHTFSYGIGFRQHVMDVDLAVDYAYTPFGVFNSVHRWSLGFGL